MKKLFLGLAILCAIALMAEEKFFIHTSNSIKYGMSEDQFSEITFPSSDKMSVTANGTTLEFDVAAVDSMTFFDKDNVVEINYNGTDASVVNPLAFAGVSITNVGADITVNSTSTTEVEYRLTGTATDGSFKIYSPTKFILSLNGVNITNADGAAINSQCKKKMTLKLADGTTNYLTDGSTYNTTDGEDMKGTLFSEGKIDVYGPGTLDVTGKYKHAIAGDDEIIVNSGSILVNSAASDAIHSKDVFEMIGGSVQLAATGDGIDGDEGNILITGGTLNISATQNTTKAIKCDGKIDISGGTLTLNTSGGVVVESGDPSYCTAIKTDSIMTITGGTINITTTGAAGKGISVDKDLIISGGDITITTSGNGATYTNTSSVADSYAATCISVDRNLTINGGNISCTSTGSAGKGISVDGDLVIGDGSSSPIVSASTSGAKFWVSGSGQNADYANPKAIKAGGNLTINSGHVTASTKQDGGEGLESKNILTINGGIVESTTYDDAINAAKAVVINGGQVYAYASGNDGIDSNGTFTITGGVIIASGTNTPEEGFDCDQNNFAITGGILIGTGGSTSTPTASSCTQKVVLYGGSGTLDQYIDIRSSAGADILTYKIPRTYNQMTLLFSSPSLSNTSYTIYKGGSVTGGTDFHGYVTGGAYTPGTSASTFTASSTVTTVGSTGGGPGGGGGRP